MTKRYQRDHVYGYTNVMALIGGGGLVVMLWILATWTPTRSIYRPMPVGKPAAAEYQPQAGASAYTPTNTRARMANRMALEAILRDDADMGRDLLRYSTELQN